ncbi:hypothetical protein HYALB_00008662 [Hymenoscyphus albidus]|uniref:Uncharacterized protein n=1 Tax=Hymenoscyphus albidus TaxID=595503 RepID=A0A9N9LKE6_9HELO|nr:hypothetical protein HYALB_00008662 [Hymenoscyphus albidus]
MFCWTMVVMEKNAYTNLSGRLHEETASGTPYAKICVVFGHKPYHINARADRNCALSFHTQGTEDPGCYSSTFHATCLRDSMVR